MADVAPLGNPHAAADVGGDGGALASSWAARYRDVLIELEASLLLCQKSNFAKFSRCRISIRKMARYQESSPIMWKTVSRVAIAIFFVACGSPIEESIDKLGRGPEEQAAARHELVLASQHAIEPLIKALESPLGTKVRAEAAAILVGLMVRLMDERSTAVIERHLLEDPDPMVRGRIAEELGLHLRSEFFDLFLQAVADRSPTVQAPALLALGDHMGQLDEGQTRTLRQLAGERAGSENEEVREAALYLVEEYVAKWAGKAREAALKANLLEADSLFGVAVAYAPASKQARYYQGTYYLDFVERERGIEALRTHRLLVGRMRASLGSAVPSTAGFG